MKRPDGLSSLSIDAVSRGPYPANGFVSFFENEVGNGDYSGLYWPFGREASEPIICDMYHDQWLLVPTFSSLGKFLEWFELNGEERGDEPAHDPDFGPEKCRLAKERLQQNSVPEAIALLCDACEDIPEVSEYWTLLSGQYFREGNAKAAAKAAISAYCSNWSFGLPSEQTLKLLARSAGNLPDSDDPLLKRVGEFNLSFGGAKQNDNYDVMQRCIHDYLQSDQPLQGLRMHQNYAFMMTSETVSFRERYEFDLGQWQDEHARLCEKYIGSDRQPRI